MEQLIKDPKRNFYNELSKASNDHKSQVTDPIKIRIDLQCSSYSLVATLLIDLEDSKPPNFRVTHSNGLACVLGLSETDYEKTGIFQGSRIVNLSGINAIYVYCYIVEPQILGDVLTQLRDVIPVKERLSENISRPFDKPHYCSVLKKNFSNIHIFLRDRNSIRFRKGKAIITLHLRRQKL